MPMYFMSVAVVLLSAFSLHPIHVSVCDIEYDEERQALEVVQRIFLDDLEKAIRAQEGKPQLDITRPEGDKTTDEMVGKYLKDHFHITVNGKEESYNYLGHEIEADALYAYVEIEKVKKLKSVKVFSSILTDIYDDQVNLVHVKVSGKIRSMKLTERDKSDVLTYDK